MHEITRILVPIDFSDYAARALDHARAIAERHGAEIELLHVIEEPTFPAFYGAAYAAAYGEPPADLEEEARVVLSRLAKDVEGTDVTHGVSYSIRRGHAGTEIIRLARQHDIDLIVIGSHGLTGMDRMMLGSVAEKVVRGSPCPVYVVKGPDTAWPADTWAETAEQAVL